MDHPLKLFLRLFAYTFPLKNFLSSQYASIMSPCRKNTVELSTMLKVNLPA